MKTKLLVLLLLFPIYLFSQEDLPKEKINQLITELKDFVAHEKSLLKKNIMATDSLVAKGVFSKEQAIEAKQKLSTEASKNIEKKISSSLEGVNQNIKKIVEETLASTSEKKKDSVVSLKIILKEPHEIRVARKKKRTYNRLIFSLGLNNTIINNRLTTLDDSPYDIWGSNFIELGYGYRTAFNKNNPIVGVDYGLNILWKELKLFNNQYHVKQDDNIIIATHSENLKKSKLRATLLEVPIFLDVDFRHNDKKYKNRSLRFGIGGYIGLKINSKQIIKYKRPRDSKKDKIRDGYNINNVNYGIAGYLGYNNYVLYTKYDLHPFFNHTEISNVAVGIRHDF